MLLEDIVDINKGEKTLMTMWSEHVIKYVGLGQEDLARVLSDFVKSHFNAVSNLRLYCNFVCHVTTMQQAGLIAQETMVDTIAHMQMKIGSRSPRRPCMDPIADLAVRFPSLVLTTTGVLHSRVHDDRVLRVTRSKEDEESRLQERILPEIVSTDANYDDMPRRGRRTRSGGI